MRRKQVNTGCRTDKYDSRDFLYIPRCNNLPIEVDNRSNIVRVLDQRPEGSCTGHAICSAAELLFSKRDGRDIHLSPRWAYRKAREIDEWPGENYEGSSTRAAIKAWANYGICQENYWPYEAYEVKSTSSKFDVLGWERKPNQGAEGNALKFPLISYLRCSRERCIDFRYGILENGFLIVGAEIHSGWKIWGKRRIEYRKNFKYLGDHTFLIVGFNEERRVYYVLNSWGEGWGEQGFAEYFYDDAHERIHDAWVVNIPGN